MRTLLKITVPVEAGNKAINDGTLPATLKALAEKLKPEAMYFTPTGQRSAMLVFDLADTSQIPSIAEPLFENLQAQVEFHPVMNFEDLQKGLSTL